MQNTRIYQGLDGVSHQVPTPYHALSGNVLSINKILLVPFSRDPVASTDTKFITDDRRFPFLVSTNHPTPHRSPRPIPFDTALHSAPHYTRRCALHLISHRHCRGGRAYPAWHLIPHLFNPSSDYRVALRIRQRSKQILPLIRPRNKNRKPESITYVPHDDKRVSREDRPTHSPPIPPGGVIVGTALERAPG